MKMHQNEGIEESRSIDLEKLEKILTLPENEYEENVMKMYKKKRIFFENVW